MTSLDVFSDPTCPWCLIGKAQLERALVRRPHQALTIRWHPFQLNPDLPRGGMDRQAYLAAKFGGVSGAATELRQVAAAAAEADVEIDLDAITRTPNTLDAQRLIFWAEVEGVQSEVVDALFAAYFREGRDIGDVEVLSDVADAAGMDAALVSRLLRSDTDRDEIAKRDAAAREMGVTAVPTFIVAGQHAVPGAQPTDLWLKVFDEIAGQA